MAKKAADKARKEAEQDILREAENKRINAIPEWKRNLLGKKEDPYGSRNSKYEPIKYGFKLNN